MFRAKDCSVAESTVQKWTGREWCQLGYQAHIAARDLYYPYVPYPYIEWYAANGRVVLELEPSHVEVVKSDTRPREKTPAQLLEDGKQREKAFASFFEGMVKDISTQNREKGGNVTGIVV